MRTVRSSCGEEQAVAVRRTESADAREIDALLGPSGAAVFGKVDVIHLLERANLAVTLAGGRGEVVGHACFLDHPIAGLVDQGRWEADLHQHLQDSDLTPSNTLFLHLFVAQPSVAPDSLREIFRAVFHAVTELQYICLVSPHLHQPGPVLEEVLEPLQTRQGSPPCVALVSHRHQFCPRLHVRRARVEDHDDLLQMFSQQSKELSEHFSCFSLAQLIEDQDQRNQTAVCESGGRAVGFMSLSLDVDVEVLDQNFDLSALGGLYQPTPDPHLDGRHENLTESGAEPCVGLDEENVQQEAPEGCAGRPGVFCIQMFLMDQDHEDRSVDFLPYIFKLFTDQDLCVVLVPRMAPEGPLLQAFQRVPPRPSCSPPQELYLFHRTGLLRSLVVRRVVSADRAAVCDLVAGFKGQQCLLEDLDMFLQARRDPEGCPMEGYVAQAEGQVVGVLILKNEQDLEFLRAHYNMESFIYFSQHGYQEHGRLLHLSLLPLFHRHGPLFLREVLRLAHKTCLYLRTSHLLQQAPTRSHTEDWVLDCMVPLAPRRQVVYPLEEMGQNAPSWRITQQQEAFAVRLLTRKLTLEPKVVVNLRVVVVGASQTALSFLEVLCLCPHLRFNGLTLISPHGFPDNRIQHDDAHFLSTSCPSSRCSDSRMLTVRSCVSVVTGRMVALQRDQRRVVLSGGALVPYDHLIIATGLQYQVPRPPGTPPVAPVPPNLLTLTDPQDCAAARDLVCQEVLEQGDTAIVYGRSLDVYTCVEALLVLGVPGSRVHLVLTPSETTPAPCCFGDPEVRREVEAALQRAGVAVHPDCVLTQMDTDQTTGRLTSVTFSSQGAPLHLPCGVLMNFSLRAVDRDVFRSVQRAGLVFDGRLVVDAHSFLTVDPAVRAAGPLTKYPRRCHAEGWAHACYCSREVGRALAAAMLALFDPTVDPPTGPPSPDHLIPEYSEARVQAGRLPGGFHYLHITKPSPLTPAQQGPPQQGVEVVTGAAQTGNYFRVHLDRYEAVDTLTCLSREPLPLSNYLCLYGRHQQLLNHLLTSSQQGLTSDLYRWFREPWSLALFHDRFPDLEQEVQQGLASARLADRDSSSSVTELIHQLVSGRLDLGEEQDPALFLRDRLAQSDARAALRSSALNYLRFNRSHLPVYALRGTL